MSDVPNIIQNIFLSHQSEFILESNCLDTIAELTKKNSNNNCNHQNEGEENVFVKKENTSIKKKCFFAKLGASSIVGVVRLFSENRIGKKIRVITTTKLALKKYNNHFERKLMLTHDVGNLVVCCVFLLML